MVRALRRAEAFHRAGADMLFVEAPRSRDDLARLVGALGTKLPLLANMVEGGGQTPVLPPDELQKLGFNMVAYPVTVLFRVARGVTKELQ